MVEQNQVARSKRIQRRTGKTFHVATRLLPQRIRHPTYVLYGFFRIADEVVDAEDTAPPDEQRAELDRLRAAALGEEPTDDPVLEAFSDVRERNGIRDADVHSFVDAMASDIDTDRYETYADLEEYMDGSAAAVGRMMTAIMDLDAEEEAEALPHATKLGEAFQMTNFLRDVREDVVERDRIYLPLETLRRHGVSEEQILELEFDTNVAAAVRGPPQRAGDPPEFGGVRARTVEPPVERVELVANPTEVVERGTGDVGVRVAEGDAHPVGHQLPDRPADAAARLQARLRRRPVERRRGVADVRRRLAEAAQLAHRRPRFEQRRPRRPERVDLPQVGHAAGDRPVDHRGEAVDLPVAGADRRGVGGRRQGLDRVAVYRAHGERQLPEGLTHRYLPRVQHDLDRRRGLRLGGHRHADPLAGGPLDDAPLFRGERLAGVDGDLARAGGVGRPQRPPDHVRVGRLDPGDRRLLVGLVPRLDRQHAVDVVVEGHGVAGGDPLRLGPLLRERDRVRPVTDGLYLS